MHGAFALTMLLAHPIIPSIAVSQQLLRNCNELDKICCMRLGKQEQKLLVDISLGDQFFGILTSAGSNTLIHKHARERARARAGALHRHRTRQRLEQLAARNLITLEKNKQDWKASLTHKGKTESQIYVLARKTRQLAEAKQWDQLWRVVMFDIPREHTAYRSDLRRLLCMCGYIQAQQSVYVFPYENSEVFEYIAQHQVLGGYVHVIVGTYWGDDSKLRRHFNLAEH